VSTNPKEALGIKKASTRYVPRCLMVAVGGVMALGGSKYGPFNWRQNPVEAMTYVEAIDRHLAAWAEGEDTDPESGESHLAHIAACCGLVIDAQEYGTLIDNRVAGPVSSMLAARDLTPRKTDLSRCSHGI